MCRLFILRHSKCGHFYRYEPVNQCEAGFSYAFNKCLAEHTASYDIGNTIPLFDHPYCINCIKLGSRRIYLSEMIQEIRKYYARQESEIIRDAKQLGLSYKEMNNVVMELRLNRTEEVRALQVNSRFENAYDCASEDPVGLNALGKRIASVRLDN